MADKPWQKTPKVGGRRGIPAGKFGAWVSERPRPIHILFFLMLLLLGAAATTTVRSHSADPLAGLSEEQLVTLLGELQLREDDLRAERSELQGQLEELSEAADNEEAAAEAAQKTLWRAEVSAGVVPVSGPGVVVTTSAPAQPFPVSVFVTTLAELRNAGAEAIEINGVRVTGRTWFASSGGEGVIVDGTVVTPPYVWRAIGDPETLAMALEIRGGANSQQRGYGSEVQVEKSPMVKIDSVATVADPVFATLGSE